MIICGVDLETTGLDANKDQITEIGAVLWDTQLNAPIKFFNKLLKINGNVPPEITKLTGIDDALLEKYGEPAEKVLQEYADFRSQADMEMAHNAPFDRGFLEKAMGPSNKPWIDSSVDIEYPESISTRKLIHLAAEHKFVNPFAHRALSDVLTMFHVVSLYDWKKTVENALTPNVTLRAMVGYNDNQKAKNVGFRWDAVKKVWIKQVKETKVQDEVLKCEKLGFLVKKVG